MQEYQDANKAINLFRRFFKESFRQAKREFYKV